MHFDSFKNAEGWLEEYIPKAKKQLYTADWGLARVKRLLNYLGDPQEKVNVIHVAGTSGKGSTCYFLEAALRAHGFKTGFTLSPHIQNLRERIQLSGMFVSEEMFCRHLEEVASVVEKNFKTDKPTFFEIVIALAFFIFYKQSVDYAVVETGLGGEFDATNCVKNPNKVCVITKIGIDHAEILGKTIAEIATQKAGITQDGNVVFIGKQTSQVALDTLQKVVHKRKGRARELAKNVRIKTPDYFPAFQQENILLALSVLQELAKRDSFTFHKKLCEEAIATVHIPGRFEVFSKNSKTIILDGAHNPQKMRALLSGVKTKFPNKKIDFLLAFKEGKDVTSILRQIAPLASTCFLTNFSDSGQGMAGLVSIPPSSLRDVLLGAPGGKNVKIEAEENPHIALKKALKSPNTILIITGSFYLLGSLYTSVRDLS